MKTPDDFARLIGEKQAEARKNAKPRPPLPKSRRIGTLFLGLGAWGAYEFYSVITQAKQHVPNITYNGKFIAAAPILILLGITLFFAGDASDLKFLDRGPKWLGVLAVLAAILLGAGFAFFFDSYMSSMGYRSSFWF